MALAFGAMVGGRGAADPANDVVRNGTFWTPYVVHGWIDLNAPSGVIPGWTIARGRGRLVGTYWQAAAGRNSLTLDGTSGGSAEQELRTTPGAPYVLRFMMAGDPDGPQRFKNLRVRIGGVAHDFRFDSRGHSRTSMGYVEERVRFTAAGNRTPLQFEDLERHFTEGAVIGGVRVEATTPIPHPVNDSPKRPASTPRPRRSPLPSYGWGSV